MEVSYKKINITFEISLSIYKRHINYKRHIKKLKKIISIFFGEEAKLMNTKKPKTYILYS